MIIMVKRADLQRGFAELAAESARIYHFNIDETTARRAELIRYIAEHAM